MSEESALVFPPKPDAPRSLVTRGLSNGTAIAIFAVLSLLGVCGITALLTVILRDSKEISASDTMVTAVKRSPLPVSTLPGGSAPLLSAPEHHLVVPHKHPASLSANRLHVAARKHGRGQNAGKNTHNKRSFSLKNTEDIHNDTRTTSSIGADEALLLDNNGTIELDKHALVFTKGEDYYADVSKGANITEEVVEENVSHELREERRRKLLHGNTSTSDLNSSRSSSSKLGWSKSAMMGSTSTAVPTASLVISSPTTRNETTAVEVTDGTVPTTATNMTEDLKESDSCYSLVEEAAEGGPAAASRKTRPSPWLLFCFYDDRSSIRSPGFTMNDFPVQLCTDMAYCCVDVNSRGQVMVNKQLKLFMKVMSQHSLPGSHVFVTLGGHRVLVHHLDAALANTARFATELSEKVQDTGAGGLAVYLEDVEVLKHAFRIHDLIMAVRGVSVAVVLPHDLRQQVRYYRTEMYANTRHMLVISPPSQGYGGDLRQQFATCPHPRRSVHEGSSLEFIYQLSRTLLSSMVGGADYGSVAAVTEDEESAPRHLIGVSLVGLKFKLKNRSHHDVGSPGTYVRRVPYREICKQQWRHWYDTVSECFVAWDGDRSWMSSLGPCSVGFTRELANGLAVFDLDFDDHSGECGQRFPVLRALRTALISQRRREVT